MDNVNAVNKEVTVAAYYFKNNNDRLKCFPKKMEYGGKSITFTEAGLRHPTKKGTRMVHVFDMSDGTADYRLEFDAEALSWKLISISDQTHIPITFQPQYAR